MSRFPYYEFLHKENTFLDMLGEAIGLSLWLPEANDLSLWLQEAFGLSQWLPEAIGFLTYPY